ncbi:SAM-dependent methyltransferase [Nocardia sp. XZ_19_385]|uniref:SAM-dependent methyltransferase n=1 Tax=Nocardia sp. XZ_19_385 TaxID=2769488 RepID=UPI00188E3DF1|nr:SAM-dependent methyltransferase [Nocardia sp. XZ_19_385]
MRSDDDSWDITSSVGLTALGVAAMRASETRRPDALFADPFAEILVTAAGSPVWTRLVRGELGPDEQGVAESYAPLVASIVARTCYFDAYFAAAEAAGIRQFVLVASGLDSRAYRMDWPAGSVVFELDLPAVLDFKAAALTGHEPRADRRAVPVDLRQDWPKALQHNGFDPGAATAWLVEGLLRYLPADAQDRLLDDIVALSAPGSRVGLNTMLEQSASDGERAAHSVHLDLGIDLEQLLYPMEGRAHPVEWFDRRGWSTFAGDPVEVLTGHGRTVTTAEADEIGHHLLMTAIRPGGDSTR